jgi:hypothetical protein
MPIFRSPSSGRPVGIHYLAGYPGLDLPAKALPAQLGNPAYFFLSYKTLRCIPTDMERGGG